MEYGYYMISFLKNLIHRYIVWRETRKIESEIDAVFGHNRFTLNTEIIQDETQRQYTEAVIQIKNKLKQLSNGDLKSYLAKNPEITNLAEKDKDEVIEIMRKITIASGQDIKSEEDKTKMINDRINHYHELQRFNEEKQLLRQIKQAMKAGDKKLHAKLMAEWRQKHGTRS